VSNPYWASIFDGEAVSILVEESCHIGNRGAEGPARELTPLWLE
jgi:hypothetical protein